MRFCLSIQADGASDSYWVLGDGRKSHSLQKSQVEALLKEAKQGLWHINPAAGMAFGQKLYRLLNGDGLLSDIRQRCADEGEPLTLYLQLPQAWQQLPFEILADEQGFFSQASDQYLIRQVTEKNRFKRVTPEKRPMSLLFMACSPEDTEPVLDFEAEEEQITRTLEQEMLPVDMSVEDSGSLAGLKMMLRGLGPFDMVHLSGHAKLEDAGPVFFMESDTGGLAKISPDQLWQALINRKVKLLFLSGCETGGSHKQATTSFAAALVAKGIPMVIGWGLPVSDTGATRFATVLYKLLGEGLALDEAVNQARQAIVGDYRTWSLLRVFCDGTPLRPLADPPHKVVVRQKRKQTYQTLEKSQIKVLEYGFVGRRRQVQLGLRVLRGFGEKNGLLMTGTAGVGKSTLTGKLIERTKDKERIIFSGKLAEGEMLAKLLDLFQRRGLTQVEQDLKANQPFEERIKQLFRFAFQEVPTLLIFDDFEQNLVREGEQHRLPDGPRRVLQPFLEGLSWADGQTQVMITCRYPFTLVRDGKDLVGDQLQHIPLKGLEGADLIKKRRLLDHIEASPHKKAFEKASGGNPRLMEWLEALAKHVTDLDVVALAKTLANQSETFVQKYLTEMLLAAQEQTFQNFLAKASVYRTAVPAEAYATFGEQAYLERAVALTLMEREDRQKTPHYWVLPMIRDRFLAKLEDPKEVHAEAYRWYNGQITDDTWHVEERLECLHHGELAFEMMGCWQHAVWTADYYYEMCLYREGVERLEPLAKYLDKEMVTQNLQDGNHYPIKFLNKLAALLGSKGDFSGAKSLYEQALLIREQLLGMEHLDTATSLNNLGYLLHVEGDLDGAKTYYEKALTIRKQVLGEADSKTASSLNNMGALLRAQGNLAGAKLYYEKALEIRNQVLGEEDPDTARSLNNLAYLLLAQGDLAGAKPYFEKALEINSKILGEAHPETATSLNNIGAMLRAQGDLVNAKSYYKKALEIRKQLFGGAHPNTASSLNNMGCLLQAMGDLKGARAYFEKALAINRKVLGEAHPDTVLSLNNLGGLFQDQGELTEAKVFFQKALAINCEVLGEAHPITASYLNNLGVLFQGQGEFAGAKSYYIKALEIRKKVYGDMHPDTAMSLNNLGTLLDSQGDLPGAKLFYEKALEIRKKVLGDAHPDTAMSLNNLGTLLHSQGDSAGAKPYLEKALEIFEMRLGKEHPDSKLTRRNLTNLVAEIEANQLGANNSGGGTANPPDEAANDATNPPLSFSADFGGEPSLADIEQFLTAETATLDPEQIQAQEKLRAAEPKLESELLEAFCPESDYRFPKEQQDSKRSEVTMKGELGQPSLYEKLVPVFFGTHRQPTGSQHPERIFGSKRSETLHYGTCLVSIPPKHKMGEVERPSAVKLQFRPDPDHHMMILNVNLQTERDYYDAVKARMAEAQSNTAFVFVHGYNVSFFEAALRTAQMAYDLNYQGAPIFYSWPSKGKIMGYSHDEANIQWATPLLKDFLRECLINTEADHLVLIGHSMGNRGLTRAVVELVKENPQFGPKLKEIILAAPDIDAAVFKRDLLPPMLGLHRPVTLYAGATDFALWCSKKFHGYPRAGHSKDGIIIVPGMETIDATHAATGFLRHSYVSKSRDVIYDIGHMIRHNHRADDRPTLNPLDTAKGRYWEFRP